jgi:hypothetical protein
MPPFRSAALVFLLLLGSLASARAAETPLPDAIAAPGETVVVTLHAEGAQVYECKAGTDGKPTWAFREPVATLLLDGKTVGRHYAGPNWEHSDGSAVVGKAAASAGREAERYSLVEARGDFPARQRRSLRRHDGAADQYAGWNVSRRVRQGRRDPQRALLRGLSVPA